MRRGAHGPGGRHRRGAVARGTGLCVRILIAVLALWAGVAVGSPATDAALQPGDPLPSLEGRTLTGRRMLLPDSLGGRRALLLLGFSYASRKDVDAWAARIRRDLPADSTFDLYEVPMMGGAARLGRPFIERGMRKGTPKHLHDRVITVYRDTAPWKPRVALTDADVAYLLLVGPDGRIEWSGHGPLGDARLAELRVALLARP